MPPKKKTKVSGNNADKNAAVAVHQVHQLEDIMAIILSWLRVEEIMCSRRVCKKWKEAVRKTIVPLSRFGFYVDDVQKYNAVRVMAREMPNLQQIRIGFLGRRPGYTYRHKWSDGEDPDERVVALAVHYTPLDIEIISHFNKLRILEIDAAPLNGAYPFLFSSFPMLQKLTISGCYCLKWDLEMLAELSMLKELDCEHNYRLTGNINSLRVLKDSLEKVHIKHCSRVEGNFMDLAGFPLLKELNLLGTAVTGDIRDFGEHYFSALERLDLPKRVYGGNGYELQRISDAPDLGRAVYTFNKQRPSLKMSNWYGILSRDSPDWYESVDDFDYPSPFYIRIVEAGSRVGYRWTTDRSDESCEVNWLNPQPDRGSSDYEEYIVQLEKIQDEIGMYRGFHHPPTEEEYHRLVGG